VAETGPQIIVCHPTERMAVRNGGAVATYAERVRHDDDDDDDDDDDESTSFCRANGPKDAAELFPVAGMSSRIGVRAEVPRQSSMPRDAGEEEKQENHVKPASRRQRPRRGRRGPDRRFEIPKLS